MGLNSKEELPLQIQVLQCESTPWGEACHCRRRPRSHTHRFRCTEIRTALSRTSASTITRKATSHESSAPLRTTPKHGVRCHAETETANPLAKIYFRNRNRTTRCSGRDKTIAR